MRTLILSIAALAIFPAMLASSGASAGIIISQSRVEPLNAASLPFYFSYDVVIEREYAGPYHSFFTMTFFPHYICATPANCPRIAQPVPSYLIVDGTYYDTCNGFVQNAHSNSPASPIRFAALADNYSWACPFPPLAPATARIQRWDGSIEQLVGFRIR